MGRMVGGEACEVEGMVFTARTLFVFTFATHPHPLAAPSGVALPAYLRVHAVNRRARLKISQVR
jgi:hypothetical protein